MAEMKSYAHKIGAIFYILWGILHIVGAAILLGQASAGAAAVLAAIGTGTPAAEIPPIGLGLTASVLAYYAWNILWVGLFVVVIAVRFNWRNNPLGFWLNLAVVGAVDLGLVILLIAPGHMAISDGMWGVILFIPALIFSAIGLFNGRGEVETRASLA
ncbi:MAG: hypothetical protein R3293_24315 [Candidatus Promineifilaceae bacterium]|nr:hypothetical protein [Candidatus Promineifilaceae bacterium]